MKETNKSSPLYLDFLIFFPPYVILKQDQDFLHKLASDRKFKKAYT